MINYQSDSAKHKIAFIAYLAKKQQQFAHIGLFL